jgi:hypothetical protein
MPPISGGAFMPAADYDISGANTHSGVETFSTAPRLPAGFIDALETPGAAALAVFGVSTIVGSSSGAARAYTLGAPVAGVRKSIVQIGGSSSGGTSTVTLSTGTYDGAATIATFTSQGSLNLVGISATRWGVVGISSATVALT